MDQNNASQPSVATQQEQAPHIDQNAPTQTPAAVETPIEQEPNGQWSHPELTKLEDILQFEDILQEMRNGHDPPDDHAKYFFQRLKRAAFTVLPPSDEVDIHNVAPSCDFVDLISATSEAFERINEMMDCFDKLTAEVENREGKTSRYDRLTTWLNGLVISAPGSDKGKGVKNAEDADSTVSLGIIESRSGNIPRSTQSQHSPGSCVPKQKNPPLEKPPETERRDDMGVLGREARIDDAIESENETKNNNNDESGDEQPPALNIGSAKQLSLAETSGLAYDNSFSSYSEGLGPQGMVPVDYAIHVRYPLPEKEKVLSLRRQYEGVRRRMGIIQRRFDPKEWVPVTHEMMRLMLPILNRKTQLAHDAFFAAVSELEVEQKRDPQTVQENEVFYIFHDLSMEFFDVVWPNPFA